jgi:hypothetical protein
MRFKSNTAGHLTRSLARPRAALMKQVERFCIVRYWPLGACGASRPSVGDAPQT